MSGAVITLVAKMAATVLSAKTAIEGLQEGNLAKAVIGGIGAYTGISGLGTQSAAAAAGSDLEAQTLTKMGGEAAKTSAKEVMEQNVSQQAMDFGQRTAGPMMESSGLGTVAAKQMPSTVAPSTVAPSTAQAAETGLLGRMKDIWNNIDPEVKLGAMNFASGALQGHAAEEMLKDKWGREERLMDEERKRRGYMPEMRGIIDNTVYSPNWGWRGQ